MQILFQKKSTGKVSKQSKEDTIGTEPLWSCILTYCIVASCNACYTLGGIGLICFRFHSQQTLPIQIQGSQGCQTIRNFMTNSKILIARSTIQPKLSKIKNHLPVFDEFWCISYCFFGFTQFWLDGRPGNEYFWIAHKVSDLLTPLTPLGLHPQWFKTTVWNRYERFLLLWCY